MHIDPNFITVALAVGGVAVATASMYIDNKIEKALRRLTEKINWCEKEIHVLNAQMGKDVDSFLGDK